MMALLGAVGYGMGGVGGRRSHPELIPIAIQTVGIMVAVLAVVLGLGGAPTASVLVWGAVSGIGNGALLRARQGEMSVVAPVSAVVRPPCR